jgi:hypothetical protein
MNGRLAEGTSFILNPIDIRDVELADGKLALRESEDVVRGNKSFCASRPPRSALSAQRHPGHDSSIQSFRIRHVLVHSGSFLIASLPLSPRSGR